MNHKEISDIAFEWVVDYKPFETDLHYKEYAKYGFEKGYEEAMKKKVQETDELLKAIDNARTICPFTGDVLINFSEVMRKRNNLK